MIIVGKGSDLKEIGFAGIEKCSNCKNYSPFRLCEYSQKLTAYFIPVLRYNRQLVYLCETCNQAFSVREGMEDEVVRSTVALPSREDAQALWNMFDQRLTEVLSSTRGRDKAMVVCRITSAMTKSIDELSRVYQPEHVGYVYSRYAQYLGDNDGPG